MVSTILANLENGQERVLIGRLLSISLCWRSMLNDMNAVGFTGMHMRRCQTQGITPLPLGLIKRCIRTFKQACHAVIVIWHHAAHPHTDAQ